MKPHNTCPKADRCKYAADCVNHDTFRGEYLCFENKILNIYEYEQNRRKESNGKKHKSKWTYSQTKRT